MYRKTFEVTGYTHDGAAYCPDHRPSADTKEVGVIYLGDEWDCPGPSCDVCHELIECTPLHHRDCGCSEGE